MAKYYSSTFGKISGKHGTAVAVIMKNGTTYLRLHNPASNPRTDKQQAHRAKFALTSKSLVPFNPIFKETIGITDGISTARSYAFKNAIVGEYPNLSIDYEKIMFSFGPIEKLQNASLVRNNGLITINWDFKKMHNCHKDDKVNLVVFNKEANQALHINDIASRADKECQIDINEAWADAELYLWAYATRGDKISDSIFIAKSAGINQQDCPSDDYSNSECDINEQTDNEPVTDTQNKSSNETHRDDCANKHKAKHIDFISHNNESDATPSYHSQHTDMSHITKRRE